MITDAGGRGTDCGVMKRGAGLASTGSAGSVLAAGTAGFGGTAEGGATVGRGITGATGRAGATGWAARCVIAFSTSPGLEMCERSILGLNSSAAAAARVPRLGAGDCSAKYLFTRSASSASIELECVFFSVMPTLGRASRTSLLLTSSSRARSLIRTLCCCITPRSLRFVPSGYAFIAPSRFSGQWPVASGQLRSRRSVAGVALIRSLLPMQSRLCSDKVSASSTGHWPLSTGFRPLTTSRCFFVRPALLRPEFLRLRSLADHE